MPEPVRIVPHHGGLALEAINPHTGQWEAVMCGDSGEMDRAIADLGDEYEVVEDCRVTAAA